MVTLVKPTELAEQLHYDIECQEPVKVYGSPGNGKSEIMEQAFRTWCKAMGYIPVICEFSLASIDSVDLRGPMALIQPAKPLKEGEQATDWRQLLPKELHTSVPTGRFGEPPLNNQIHYQGVQAMLEHGCDWDKLFFMVFFDEASQAPVEVMRALGPVILKGVVADMFPLPKNHWCALAGNKMEDQAGTEEELSHIMNRHACYELLADAPQFVVHGKKIGIHRELLAWAMSDPEVAFSVKGVPAELVPFSTSRMIFKVSKVCHAILREYPNQPVNDVEFPTVFSTQSNRIHRILKNAIESRLGNAGWLSFSSYLKYQKDLPTIEQVVADPDGAKYPATAHLRYGMTTRCMMAVDVTNFDPIMKYMSQFPRDMQGVFVNSIQDNDELLDSGSLAYAQWTSNKDNQALIFAGVRLKN